MELEKKRIENHVMYTDDLKLCGKNNEQINSLVNAVGIFSYYIGVESRAKKCGTIVMYKKW